MTIVKRIAIFSALSIVVAVCILTVVSCETSGGSSGLTVTPKDTTLSAGTNTVTLTVDEADLKELSLPLEWSVDDPTKGTILAGGDVTAVYTRSGLSGVNVVNVKDQFGAQGRAFITQP